MTMEVEMPDSKSKKLLERLNKFAKAGCNIKIVTKTMGEISGILEEIDDEWLTINSHEGISLVDISEIINFSFPRNTIAKALQPSATAPVSAEDAPVVESASIRNETKQLDTALTTRQISTAVEASGISVDDKLLQLETVSGDEDTQSEEAGNDTKMSREDYMLRLIFHGIPKLSVPDPIFDDRFKDNTALWKLLNPWRDKYSYAIKIKEFNRLLPLVNDIKKEAEKYSECEDTRIGGYLYYLAGLFIYHGGHSPSESRELLKKAIDYGYIDASLAYGALLLQEKNYDLAAISLAKAVKLCDGQDCDELIKIIGQCMMQKKSDKLLAIGEILEAKKLSKDYQEMARRLIAYMVQEDTEAVDAAIEGNVEKLRMTRIGNDLFPWKQTGDNIDFSNIAEVKPAPEIDSNNRRGKITAFWPERNMGFITENQTGQSWYMNLHSGLDEELEKELLSGRVNQEVSFRGDVNSGNGRYPNAMDIRGLSGSAETLSPVRERTPLAQRLANIPKSGGYYANAKRAEQLDQLEEAKDLYQQEIDKGPNSKYYKSAIKDLASLINRTDGKSAVATLEKYASAFTTADEVRSIQQMKAQFYVKAQEYQKAATIFQGLAKGLVKYDTKRCSYLQQEAYCYYALGKYDTAILKLENLIKNFPGNEAIVTLLSKIEEAKEQGRELPLEDFQQIAGELPPLSMMRIEKCKLDGIEAQAKEKSNFSDADIDRISYLIADVREKRPLERSKFRLTVAWLQKELGKPFDELYNTMCRYFYEQARGSAYDSSIPPEVIRCYALESLRLAVPQSQCNYSTSRGIDKWVITADDPIIEETWTLLVASYQENPLSPQELTVGKQGIWLTRALDELKKNNLYWSRFIADLSFIRTRVKHVFTKLDDALKKIGIVLPLIPNDQENSYYQKEAKLYVLFENISSMTADKFNQIREQFLLRSNEYKPPLDKSRTNSMLKILEECSTYTSQRNFWDKERVYLQLKNLLENLLEECAERPTTLSIEKMYPALKKLWSLLENDFAILSTQEPEFKLKNVLDTNMYAVEQDGMLSLKLLLSSTNESAPPVASLRVFPENKEHKFDGGDFPEPIGAGEKEFEFRVKPLANELKEKAFSLNLKIEYRSLGGATKVVGPFAVSVQLGKGMTSDIENVYAQYAGGAEVEDEKMFFGRDELVNEICTHLSEHSGQCFVLYGQKRSGKTSVLRHVGKKLPKNCFFTEASALSFNYEGERVMPAFVKEIYDPVVEKIEDLSIDKDADFPTYEDAKLEPQRTLRRISKFLAAKGYQWVIAIDEFTAIYADKKEEVAAFMHAWKSFLEAKLFNALIIGQDTMPRFKNEYPNDFCVTHDKRITFLSKESSFKMATEPILLNNESRYRGNALEMIYGLTSGSPYFLQKICSAVVDYINHRRTPFITGADIENVAESMTRGERKLESEVFDALVTAGEEKHAVVPRERLWQVLTRIALQSRQSGWCSRNELEDIENANVAIKDLIERDTLLVDEDKLRIKVELFSMWLRINMRGV